MQVEIFSSNQQITEIFYSIYTLSDYSPPHKVGIKN